MTAMERISSDGLKKAFDMAEVVSLYEALFADVSKMLETARRERAGMEE
jgi:hypothetical protein